MKKTSSGKKSSVWLKIGLLLLAAALAAGSCAAVYIFLKRTLFTDNKKLALFETVVESFSENYDGYWNPLSPDERHERIKELNSYVRDSAGAVEEPLPLFSFDLGDLRRRIMIRNPEIRSVSIRRELPDRLVFSITERVPRAVIGNTDYYIDDFGMVMRRDKSQKVFGSLPLIFVPNASSLALSPGDDVAKKTETGNLLFALKILEEFRPRPDIRLRVIRFINDIDKPRIECDITYGQPSSGEHAFTLWLDPYLTADRLRNDISRRLQPMLDIGVTRQGFNPIDLRFDNMAKQGK